MGSVAAGADDRPAAARSRAPETSLQPRTARPLEQPVSPTQSAARVATIPATQPITGGQAVWETLVQLGVTHVFGYPGGAILPTYDAMPSSGIAHVLVRHEQGAAHMADGFARATGRVGVAMATSGPGATNLVTGIATAMMDGSPIVCITGQVHSAMLGLDAFQEVDITGITMPITKHNFLVTDPARVAPTIAEAFEIALSGRPGPVLVDITKDAQQGACERPALAHRMPRASRAAVPAPDASACDAALALIAESRRPVILAGHGVLAAGATAALRAFAERTGIPVATTLLGIGAFPGTHGLSLGMIGMHGEAFANQAVQDADLLIAIGMRFDDRAVGHVAGYAPRARRIHVDIDAAAINKMVKVDVAVVGDAADVLDVLLRSVRPCETAAWLAEIESRRHQARSRDIQNLPDDGKLHAAHVMRALWEETGGRAVVVTDVGQHQMWEAQYYLHDRPRTLITSGGLGTMGFGLPAGIGAKLARPDEEVWVVAGDGGFQMTSAELATVAQEGIDLKIAVVNNGYLGMVRQWQEFFYDRRYNATPLRNPDFCLLAAAHGISAIRVTARDEMACAIRTARQTPGPVLVEFRVEQEDVVYPMVPAGRNLGEMIRRPVPGPHRLAPAQGGA
jgi:acetolactate synthase I/II/III large subunit